MLRVVVLVALIALGGLAIDGTSFALVPETAAHAAAGPTCDGWPHPVEKILDECPHGPVP